MLKLTPIFLSFILGESAIAGSFCKSSFYLEQNPDQWRRTYDIYVFKADKSIQGLKPRGSISLEYVRKNYEKSFSCESKLERNPRTRDIQPKTNCTRLDIQYSFDPFSDSGFVISTDGFSQREQCDRDGCIVDKNKKRYIVKSSSFSLLVTPSSLLSTYNPIEIIDEGNNDGKFKLTYWSELNIESTKYIVFSYMVESGYVCKFNSEGSNPQF
ncbi:hypothetical protein [Synechococcus elongatus]|uniref:hypothetical protein n=1 Tax=Synechococcus elongatus TaxID=32046 RepID=UPI0030D52EF8